MGLFNNMFGSKSTSLPHNWKVLNDDTSLAEIDRLSHQKPVAILKHSTSCGISHMIKVGLEREWNLGENELDFYYLDLLHLRHISNEIMEHYKVPHQSPQIVLIRNGKAVYHASHQMVSAANLKKALNK